MSSKLPYCIGTPILNYTPKLAISFLIEGGNPYSKIVNCVPESV